MCWPTDDDPLLGCTRQRAMLSRAFGPEVIKYATAYASKLPQPLPWHSKLACISIAMKYTEDDILYCSDLFPGLDMGDLKRAEWSVLESLKYKLSIP